MRIPRVLLAACILLMLADFAVRGIIPAFAFGKNDFSDPFCAAWLWRHGQNPYDAALATAVSQQLANSAAFIVPVYPPAAYVLVAPLSMLPWKSADLIWEVIAVAGVALSAFALVRLSNLAWKDDRAWLLAALAFAAGPFHTAVHVGNGAAIATGMCLMAVCLAEQDRDLSAGLILAAATCLKPQLGIWIFVFYLLRRAWRLVVPGLALTLLLTAIAAARLPLSLADSLWQYRQNLHYWIRPGGLNDFTAANPMRFELVNAQVVLYPLLHSVTTANALAWSMFLAGGIVWLWIVVRAKTLPTTLAISSLLALAMLPMYHRTYDVALLLLVTPWVLRTGWKKWGAAAWAVVALLFTLLLPSLPGAVLFATLRGWGAAMLLSPAASMVLLSVALLYCLAVASRQHGCELLSGKEDGAEQNVLSPIRSSVAASSIPA